MCPAVLSHAFVCLRYPHVARSRSGRARKPPPTRPSRPRRPCQTEPGPSNNQRPSFIQTGAVKAGVRRSGKTITIREQHPVQKAPQIGVPWQFASCMILIAEPAGPAAQADDGSLSPGRRGVPLVDSDGHGGRLPPALWNPSNLNSAANLRFASVKGPGGQVEGRNIFNSEFNFFKYLHNV